MNRTLLAAAVVGLSGTCIVAPDALGQNALGSGNALDANLMVGNRRNAPGRDIKKELAFRNAIVTGNAGAGLSFRGDIGYRAADDFRSTTGTDQFYDFRRDSDYSGLATLNIRGISAMQDQFTLATGGQTMSFGGNDLIVRREASGTSVNSLSADPINPNRIDPLAKIGAGTLRSTTGAMLREASRPAVLAFETRPESSAIEDQKFLIASPLQGVRSIPQRNAVFGYTPKPITGFQTPDQVAEAEAKALTEAALDQPGAAIPQYVSPYDTFRKQLETRVSGKVTSNPLDTSIEAMRKPTELTAEQREKAGLPAIEPVKAATDATKQDENSFEASLERLRETLAGRGTRPDSLADASKIKPGQTPTIPGVEPGPTTDARGPDGKPRAVNPDDLVPGTQAYRDAQIRRAIEDAQRVAGSGPEMIASLKPKFTNDELFATHMAKAEQHLADGRWFDAEERFALALALREGDPMAAAGRVHAQLAAGMYLSAAMNLRNLFRAYPDLMAAKYDEKLLPRGARLESVRSQLRLRSTRDTLVARDAGLLLMYLGWQTGSAQDIKDGLAVIDRVNEKMGIDPDPLDAALRAVWSK